MIYLNNNNQPVDIDGNIVDDPQITEAMLHGLSCLYRALEDWCDYYGYDDFVAVPGMEEDGIIWLDINNDRYGIVWADSIIDCAIMPFAIIILTPETHYILNIDIDNNNVCDIKSCNYYNIYNSGVLIK